MNLFVRMFHYGGASAFLPPDVSEPQLIKLHGIEAAVEHFLKGISPVQGFEIHQGYCFASVPPEKLELAIQALNRKFFKPNNSTTIGLESAAARQDNRAPRKAGYKGNRVHEIGKAYDGNAWWMPT